MASRWLLAPLFESRMSTHEADLLPSATRFHEENAAYAGCLWAALAVAGAGLVGSLLASWGLGLKACPLCFYQRTFMMSVAAVLGIGLLSKAVRPGCLSALALPMATAGLGVAVFHVGLELTGKLECPRGFLGLGTVPQQSLGVFAVLFALLLIDCVQSAGRGQVGFGVGAAAIGLGVVLAAASCTSNPPMPAPPAQPYPQPPDICRPPFRSVT
jgi:disulfide bond formation protein DsbB